MSSSSSGSGAAAAIAAPAAATFQELCASIDGRLRDYGYKLPEEMGMLRDSHKRSGLDVLVLSRFSVWGDELQEVWNVSGDEVSLGFWSFYCAKKDFKGNCVYGDRPAQARLIPEFDWLEYTRQAVRLLAPRLVVVLCWKGNPDSDFVSLWGKRRTGGLPCLDDVIELPDAKNTPDLFEEGWKEKVASVLYQRYLIGAPRDASGAIDAFSVIGRQWEPGKATDEQKAQERQLRLAQAIGAVTGDNIPPEQWERGVSAEDARQGLDDAVKRRKEKAKREALEAQIVRNRSQGQRQITDLFVNPASSQRKRSALMGLDDGLRKRPATEVRSAMQDADTALTNSAPVAPQRSAFVPWRRRPPTARLNVAAERAAAAALGEDEDVAHVAVAAANDRAAHANGYISRTNDRVAQAASRGTEETDASWAGYVAQSAAATEAARAAADFWSDTPLPAPAPLPPPSDSYWPRGQPYARPATAQIDLSAEYAAANALQANTGAMPEPAVAAVVEQTATTAVDEAWAREVEERLAREHAEAATEKESHAPQVSKGKYEDP